MTLLSILLQAPAQPGGGYFSLLFMVGMIAVMYFFMIRPQAKRAKEQKKFSESISVGEDIITSSGIHGRINRVNENGTLQLEVSRNTYMTFERSAISMEMTIAFRKKSTGSVVTAETTKP